MTYFTVESEGFYYHPGSAWQNSLGVDGFEFETPPPQISPDGASKSHPPSSARTPNSRTVFAKVIPFADQYALYENRTRKSISMITCYRSGT